MTPIWKGYAAQSQPWRRGYNWARQQGAHAHLPCGESAEAWGYDIDSPESVEFNRGADFAQLEEYQEITERKKAEFAQKLEELGPAYSARHPRLYHD